MIEYKYKKRENKFTENGHTMFEEDVLQRLKRLAHLEEQITINGVIGRFYSNKEIEVLKEECYQDGFDEGSWEQC